MLRDDAIQLHVGEPNPRLDALLAREGLETAACVSAPPSDEDAHHALAEALHEQGYGWLDGRAGPARESVLLVGLPREEARELGWKLRQRAVIFHQRGRRTELVFVG